MSNRPNVLFLMDDEHRYDVLGYAGNDLVRTPTLDRLADSGVVFENAYTPSPRCVPARQCLMSGQLPRTCGCERYGEGLPADTETFARQFTRYDYRTSLAGKAHFVGESSFLGYGNRIGTVGSNEPVDRRVEGNRTKNKWSDAKEIKRAGVGRAGHTRADEYAITGTEHSIESNFLDTYYDRAHPDRPTFLTVSLQQPHYPYYAADESAFQYYLNRVDPYIENAPAHAGLSEREVPIGDNPKAVTEREIRRTTAAYYAMVEHVDSLYGRVLDALEGAGEDLDEWIIVFTSDHGEMLGQHGVWEKGSFYEASARVPLFIRYPARFDAGTVTENVNLCDLFATLCELADLPVPEGRDSRSLVGLMEGDRTYWQEAYDNESISAYDERLMLKRDELKYIFFGDGKWKDPAPEVLFDLSVDPGETENVIDDPAYADAVEMFRDRRDQLGYGRNGTNDPVVGY